MTWRLFIAGEEGSVSAHPLNRFRTCRRLSAENLFCSVSNNLAYPVSRYWASPPAKLENSINHISKCEQQSAPVPMAIKSQWLLLLQSLSQKNSAHLSKLSKVWPERVRERETGRGKIYWSRSQREGWWWWRRLENGTINNVLDKHRKKIKKQQENNSVVSDKQICASWFVLFLGRRVLCKWQRRNRLAW